MRFKTYKSPLAVALNEFFNVDHTCFSYGTIEGVYTEYPEAFEILLIENTSPGNGHFKKFMRFITDYCKRENKKLAFLEIWNDRLRKKLLKEGYTIYKHNGLAKGF